MPTDRLRVLTWNVLAPVHADWARRKPLIVKRISDLAPDIIALQEVRVDDVEELIGPGWHVVPHSGRDSDGVGAVVASRSPAIQNVERDLQETARTRGLEWTGAVAIRIELPDPMGAVVVVHHKPVWAYDLEYERELQAVAAARFAEELVADRPAHVVLTGDFDAPPYSASIRFLTGQQSLGQSSVCYRDAWRDRHPDDAGHTFSPENRLVAVGDMPAELGRRIDYVLVRCIAHGPTLAVRSCERVMVRPEDGGPASDHYGVLAELAVPDRPPGTNAF